MWKVIDKPARGSFFKIYSKNLNSFLIFSNLANSVTNDLINAKFESTG